MSLLTSIKKPKSLILLFFFLSLAQLLPLLIFKEATPLPVVDILDFYIPQYKLIASQPFAFCSFDQPVNQLINGVNRDLLVSDLSIIYLLFLIFNAFWAYTVNVLLIKIIAFAGMYLFLKNNFNTFSQKQIAIGAFLFSCIPFFPFFGIGIAGQPLLANTLINFFKKKANYWDYLVLVLFPFYSSLVFTNVFIVFCLGLFCVYITIRQKKIPFHLAGATLLLFFLSLIVEYRLIHAMLTPGFIPSRTEFNPAAFITQSNLKMLFDSSFSILRNGLYHVELSYFVFVFLILCISIYNWQRLKTTSFFVASIVSIASISLLYGFVHSGYYIIVIEKIPFFRTFQIDRFYTLLPFLYFLLAISCAQYILQTGNVLRKRLLSITIVMSGIFIFVSSQPIKSIIANNIKGSKYTPSFEEYYDTELFKEVQMAIRLAPADYRIISIGLEPDASLYNGFYNLDAYLNIYPLEYKKKFRLLIKDELMKSKKIKTYFDDWGNRCYAFSSEIGNQLTFYKKDNLLLNDLSYNIKALKQITEKPVYIISTRRIKNADTLGIELINYFQNERFYRNLALYKVL
jgi:hypothetical protein